MTPTNYTHDIDINTEGLDHMKHQQHPMNASPRRRRRRAVPSVALAGVVSLVALAGCGGSSKAPSASSSTAAAQVQAPASSSTPAVSSQSSQTGTSSHAKKSKAVTHAKAHARASAHHGKGAAHTSAQVIKSTPTLKVTKGNPVHKPAPGTGGNTVNDDNPTGKASLADSGSGTGAGNTTNPCTLVSQSQASSFTGKSIGKPRVAPLGPTCVYQELGGKTEVTMALQMAAFAKLKPHIHNLSTVTIAGHTGYCGVYGTPIMLVPMAQDRLLSISAPCTVGTRFAAAALPKLVS